MTDIDPFLQAMIDERSRPLGPNDVPPPGPSLDDILGAIAAAQAAGQRATEVGDLLTDLPGSSAPLVVDGLHGIQFLSTPTSYAARIDIPGVLPRTALCARGNLVDVDGVQTPIGAGNWIVVSRAPAVARLFDVAHLKTLLAQAPRLRARLRPESPTLTVVEVDCFVADARGCGPARDVAVAIARLAKAAVDSGLVFAEAVVDHRPSGERVQALVARVTEAVSWVSGPVERVGDGVEARLAVDEQPDAPSVLRFDLDNRGVCVVFFEGRLVDAPTKTTRLTPQEGVLDRLRGLVDVKVDDAAFDDAWLIDGDPTVSKKLAAQAPMLARLRQKHAAVEVGPAGLVVRVPAFVDDDVGVVDVAGAILSLWRALCREARGYSS